jgi:hypothetical protein
MSANTYWQVTGAVLLCLFFIAGFYYNRRRRK